MEHCNGNHIAEAALLNICLSTWLVVLSACVCPCRAAEAGKENEGVEAVVVEEEEGLKPAELDMRDVDVSVSDEERMYRLWINSVGIATPVTNLFKDVSDGCV